MPAVEVSVQLARVVVVLARAQRQFLTAEEIARAAGAAPRTARHHLKNLCDEGLVEVVPVFPARRYRLTERGVRSVYLKRVAEMHQEAAE